MAPRCAQYEVTPGQDLVRSEKSEMYMSPGDEALYKIIDIHFLGYDCTSRASCLWRPLSAVPGVLGAGCYLYSPDDAAK
jgi:hypothetical protein